MDTIYEILEKVQKMKTYFDEQIKTFVIKDDFSKTFQKIDDILYQHELSLFKRQEDSKHFHSEIKEVYFQLDQRCLKKVTEEEFSKIWENFNRYCGYHNLQEFREEIRPTIQF